MLDSSPTDQTYSSWESGRPFWDDDPWAGWTGCSDNKITITCTAGTTGSTAIVVEPVLLFTEALPLPPWPRALHPTKQAILANLSQHRPHSRAREGGIGARNWHR